MDLTGESSRVDSPDARLVSVQLGRPVGVDDLDIDLPYPMCISDKTLEAIPPDQYEATGVTEEGSACSMSGFIALTKLCKLAGRVAQILYRPSHGRSVSDPTWEENQQKAITKLDRQLKDWLAKDVVSRHQVA